MKASELAERLGGVLEGADVELVACGGLEEARAGDLSFCKDLVGTNSSDPVEISQADLNTLISW